MVSDVALFVLGYEIFLGHFLSLGDWWGFGDWGFGFRSSELKKGTFVV